MSGAHIPLGESISENSDRLARKEIFAGPVTNNEHVLLGSSVPLTPVLDLQTLPDGGSSGSWLQELFGDVE